MTQSNKLQNHPVQVVSVGKRMLQGAVVALFLITVFLVSTGTPDEGWHGLWMIKPLFIVPLAGALGGVFHHNMHQLSYEGGLKKALANILSLVVFILLIWLGTVLGLNGTWWD